MKQPSPAYISLLFRLTDFLIAFQLQLAPVLLVSLLIFSLFYGFSHKQILLSLGGLALLFGISFYGTMAVYVQLQRAWDKRAQDILSSTKEGRRRSFTLYLRSFDQDRSWLDTHSGRPWWYMPALFEPRLAFALEKVAPLIALRVSSSDYESGKVQLRNPKLIAFDEHLQGVGAGRADSDTEHWQETAKILMQRCLAILIVPSKSDGLAWEIHQIRDRSMLEKCVFIMPGNHRTGFAKQNWELTAKELRRVGIRAPSFHRSGRLFTVDNSGLVRKTAAFHKWSLSLLRRSILRLL